MMRRIFALVAGLFFALAGFASAAQLTTAEQEWFEKVRLLMTPQEREAFGSPHKAARIKTGFWEDGTQRAQILGGDVSPKERERVWMKRVEYAAKEFAGESWVTTEKKTVTPNGWETQRGFLFVMGLGPPMARYVNWEKPPPPDRMTPKILDTASLLEYIRTAVADEVQEEGAPTGAAGGGLKGLSLGGAGLGGLSLPGAATGGEQEGRPRVERWTYPVAGSTKVRVFTFVEREPGGQVALYAYEMKSRAGAAKGDEVTYHDTQDPWWARPELLADCEDPPEIEAPAVLDLTVNAFRSVVPGRAHVRAVAWLDAEGVASGFGEEGLKGARLWTTVRNAEGRCVDQSIIEALPASSIHSGDPTVVETALELEPGSYDLSMVAVKAEVGTGAVGRVEIEVPDLESGLTLSSLLVTSMVEEAPQGARLRGAEEAGSVKVASQAGGAPRAEAQAFVYGPYYLVPEVDGVFTTDQTLALAFQVYNAKQATVTYTFFIDDENAGEWDPSTVTPATGGNLVQITPLEGFPSGNYEIRIHVEDEKTGQEAESSVFFRIEG